MPTTAAAAGASATSFAFSNATKNTTAISAFGGVLTDNVWEEIVLTPWRIQLEQPGLYGLAVSLTFGPELHTRLGPLRLELEGQVVRHAGLQRHWELNLPLAVRLTPSAPSLTLIETMAFGIGLSHADRPPAFERERGDGKVSRTLIYWYGELAHDWRHFAGVSVFVRLHHRSDADGLIGAGASSNGLVLGLRRGFSIWSAP